MQTKKDYEAVMLKLLNPIKPYYSNGKAYLNLGFHTSVYGKKIAGIEGFARPLWALAGYYANGEEGTDTSFVEIYRQGLANGTNPFHPEYWGEVSDKEQTLVEMTAIGYSLLIAPDTFFRSLAEEQQKNLAEWLYTINEHEVFANNWELFKLIVNIGLKNVGRPYRDDVIEESMKKLDSWQLGGGWYRDGKDGSVDYYNAFAIHFYSLLYAKSIEKAYPDRSTRLKERAKAFARDFIFWFDREGEGIAYGRSLTYRFAQVAFWSALIWADASPFSLGVVKGIINRNLRSWLASPIFDNEGLLTVGYKYPNLIMSEAYNASGSPYWAMKTFLLLALPQEHPYFSAAEEPLPELETVHEVTEAKMIVTNSEKGATLYPIMSAERDRTEHFEKYSKFAYSSKYGFSIARGARNIEMAAPDSFLLFKVKGNYYTDYKLISSELLPDKRLKLVWSPVDCVEVETIITPYESSHKREHTIKASVSCEAYETGFAVDRTADGLEEAIDGGKVFVRTEKGGCEIYSEYGDGLIIDAYPNTNIVSPLTKIPALVYKIEAGESKISATIYEL